VCLKAIKWLKLPSLRLCLVTQKQAKVMGKNLSSVPSLRLTRLGKS
jgi:hypothetical protein